MDSTVSLECSALLFDLDGVLVDSAACIEKTWRVWAVSHNLDPAYVIGVAHGRRALETVHIVAPHLAAAAELAALAASEATTTDGITEVPGARALLDQLRAGTWAIVTSGIRAVATHRLRHTGLPVPDVLISADDVQRGKPDPEGYLAAAKRLGVDPTSCIVVEDAPAGLEAASAAGMRSIGICGTYGPEALSIATYTVADFSALRVRSRGTLVELRLLPPNER